MSFLLVIALALVSCHREEKMLFTRLDALYSKVKFINSIEETPEINILSFEYTYNGGGVAAGDFNNDGLCDLYFTGNAVSNRLYINEGELKFKDVTESSGTAGRDKWKTGVATADVNGDGWLDIYVCYSGPDSSLNLSNQLFINNGGPAGGNPTFTESAGQYGLDAPGTFSTQASFFDYDQDGDLDMMLINHGNHFYSPFVNTARLRGMRHPNFGNRLYRNDMVTDSASNVKPGNHFTDVSSEAGIHGGGINFGLGISVSDLNKDGWPDVFVTNDYEEQDFLYLNNRDGTFTDATKKSFGHLSRNGMGTDVADFNNDSNVDLIEVDMWPEDNFRQKLLKGPDDYHRYNLMLDSGFHHQQMRNTLQMNVGNAEDGRPMFCEIGQFAGVSSTDWSWAPLFVDVDNDGFKDLFVTNGYLRDFTSMDFLKYTVEEERKKAMTEGRELNLYELVSKMPSTTTKDYLFGNNGDLTFSNRTIEWGMDVPNLSFGAAYADLDNDGDLELIVNNTNEEATIWVNNARKLNENNFLQVVLKGPESNPFGSGAVVTVADGTKTQMKEQFLTRGFQSSVDPVIHFGLGKSSKATVKVVWKEGLATTIDVAEVNTRVEVDFKDAKREDVIDTPTSVLFADVTSTSNVDFVHRENVYHDFDYEPLLPYMLSRLGPPLVGGDVNGDGNDDFFVGGAAGQSGELFLSDGLGKFTRVSGPWLEDRAMEDVGAVFLDADSDKDLDLFVVSGGNENRLGSALLDDRLYINTGTGRFIKAPLGAIVADHSSGSCVAAADFDNDGDVDLCVGGAAQPGNFPHASPGAVLRNETKSPGGPVKFVVTTKDLNEDLRSPGMVTDAVWTDFNKDGWMDLIIVGEWMPIRVFKNENGKLIEIESPDLKGSSGLWKKIETMDIDQDGDMDYIVGNAGINLPWKVSKSEPMTMFFSDFNEDGKTDPIITSFINGVSYPIASRDELLSQITTYRKKFRTYSSYGEASIEKILTPAEMSEAGKLYIHNLKSSMLVNLGNDSFELRDLPMGTQLSSVNGILQEDFDGDGVIDVLAGGNLFSYRTQFGPSDAGMGVLLKGDGRGGFVIESHPKTGLRLGGDVRSMILLKGNERRFVIAARNNDSVSVLEAVPIKHREVAKATNP